MGGHMQGMGYFRRHLAVVLRHRKRLAGEPRIVGVDDVVMCGRVVWLLRQDLLHDGARI